MAESKRINRNEGKWSCFRLSRRGSEGRCRQIARGSLSTKQRDLVVRQLATRRVVCEHSVKRKGSEEALDTRDHRRASPKTAEEAASDEA